MGGVVVVVVVVVTEAIGKGDKLSNPIPEFGARFAIIAPERTACRSDRRAFFDPCVEISVVELRFPADAMGEGLVGREARLFEQEKGCLQSDRERKRVVQWFFGM